MNTNAIDDVLECDADSGGIEHDWPDAPGTATEGDEITLAEWERGRAARARRAAVPGARIPAAWAEPKPPGRKPGTKNGEGKPQPERQVREHEYVGGVLYLRCACCKAIKPAIDGPLGGFFASRKIKSRFKWQSKCKVCEGLARRGFRANVREAAAKFKGIPDPTKAEEAA